MFVGSQNASLHVDVSGSTGGASILFLNALGTDLRIWDSVVSALSSRARCIRYDTTGHGLSWGEASDHISGHVDDAIRVLDAASNGKVIIVGLSVGGLIAQALAAWHPTRVAGLVVCCSGGTIGSPELWNARLENLSRSNLEEMSSDIVLRWFSSEYANANPAAIASYRAMLASTRVRSYEAMCRLLRDSDVTDLQEHIDCQAICIAGDRDKSTPPASMLESLRGIKHARTRTLEACGHLPCIEQPATLSGLIEHFVTENCCV